jgi:hypothetical protein
LAGALVIGLTAAAPAQAAVIGVIDAGYVNDTTLMTITNTSLSAFSSLVIDSVGGAFPGASETLGPLAAGATVTVPFGDIGGAFSFDYDNVTGAGDTSYQVVANGTDLSNIFSPTSNSSGGLVDFLGTHFDNDFSPVQVGSISTGVPEPSTWAMMFLGFVGLGFAGYRSAKTRAAFAA